jgi:Flp pilus assembly CpaF family ATPase
MAVPIRPPKPSADDSQPSQKPTRPVAENDIDHEDLPDDKLSFRGASLGNLDEEAENEIKEKLAKLTKKLGNKSNLNPIYKDLTVEDLLVNDWERYEYLMPKVVQVKQWVTNVLQDQNRSTEIAEARLNRGKKYDEMYTLITQLLERYYMTNRVVSSFDYKILSALVANEILGLGPLEPLWRDNRISEIMVNGPYTIRIEMGGRLMDVPGARFRDQEHANEIAQQILAPIGRSLDVSHPLQDGSLVDGSRVNIVHPSIAEKGPYITIRRFPDTVFSLKELVSFGAMNTDMAADLGNLIGAGMSTVIIGGTGSGKSLSLCTRLPIPGGFTTMDEVKVGDYVLDENGGPTMVTGYYPQPLNPCFELTFSDGTKVVADESHNWFTSTRSARRAVSRQENVPRVRDAARKPMATLEDLASIHGLYNERESLTSPATIVKSVPHLRTVIYNAAKQLKAVSSKAGGSSFYNSKELFDAVIVQVSRPRNDQRYKSTIESIVTTREIYETLRTAQGHANHAVRLLSKPVPYAEKDLIVSPYTFGAWLGDGYSSEGIVCGIDEEVFEHIINEGYDIQRTTYAAGHGRRTPMRITKFTGLHQKLKTLGVTKKNSDKGIESKFIPEDYLYSSEAQRRALIAGLLDTDGTVSKSTGNVSFTNSNKNIIDGFRQVIHSLGYQSSLTEKVPTYTYKGEKKQGKVSYTVNFFTKDDVFRLERKNLIHRELRAVKSQGHRMEYRYIVDCVPIEPVPTACISVDSPNHLYLCTDAFITTHNTSTLNALSACIPPGERVLVIEDTSELRLHPDRDILYLQARPAQHDSSGAITIRDLVKNALRMRPDRIVVGEVRDFAAYDMLQAMNTGHDGSMTTIHANDARSGVERLVNLLSEGGESAVDSNRVLSLISSGVDLFVTIQRYEDGSRRCSGIYEIPNTVTVKEGRVTLEPVPLWEFVQDSADLDEDSVDGMLKVTGHWERVNELSESMRKKHRLDYRDVLSFDEIFALSEMSSKKA